MIRLYLMRHGKAEKFSAGSDINRHLTGRGRKDSKSQAEKIAESDNPPALILSSEARRAFETAGIIADTFNPPLKVVTDSEIYHGTSEDYLSAIIRTGDISSLMVVAHNPSIEQLAALFDRTCIEMKTADIAWFDFEIKLWEELTASALPVKSGMIRKDKK